ncbi:MAG TPA: VOC family protein [Mucilaginibacter sp.]|jgi:predicted enzyme related to lactoylglutathione lyase
MKKWLLAAGFLAAFGLGYGFRAITRSEKLGPRATGIGGIFFKTKDPAAMKKWYAQYLNIRIVQSGSIFEWWQGADSTKKGFTFWAPFKETTKYFQPSEKEFMINYRVEGLEALLAKMKAAGIMPVDSVQRTGYGNFVHLMDPDGNKIELWEPDDAGLAKDGTVTSK